MSVIEERDVGRWCPLINGHSVKGKHGHRGRLPLLAACQRRHNSALKHSQLKRIRLTLPLYVCACTHTRFTEVFTLGKWALWLSLAHSLKVERAWKHAHTHKLFLALAVIGSNHSRLILLLLRVAGSTLGIWSSFSSFLAVIGRQVNSNPPGEDRWLSAYQTRLRLQFANCWIIIIFYGCKCKRMLTHIQSLHTEPCSSQGNWSWTWS